ncbi:MAG: helix-turn-helix transcriptional regulator [Reyranella sp.]|nr:helix-turn-helix transcriptional regulator [Reyranella sp.]
METVTVQTLLRTSSVTVSDIACSGACRHRSDEEHTTETHLVFPYRGVYVRHVGRDDAVAEANQVLLFNAGEGYRVSHPVPGGDACLDLVVDDSLLSELAPADQRHDGGPVTFARQRRRIDPRAQALVALLRHSLHKRVVEPLEAESLALMLARRALGPLTSHATSATFGQQRLVDRIKLTLARDLGRRRTLQAIAKEVGGSPVYLTQVFQRVEGVPLYRYQLRLRLARALDLLGQYDDLSAMSLDLGFSSHSHFSAAFRRAYGRSQTAFRRSTLAC